MQDRIINEKISQLLYLFKDDIYKRENRSNEIYLEVDIDNIREITAYVNETLAYPLISLFANDERTSSEQYALYYVFADRARGHLLILKAMIAATKAAFPSIAAKVPAAYLYEREIHDLFGLVPSGHPDPKRLVWHENWPEGVFPLRKDFDNHQRVPFVNEEINFSKVEGDGVYEILVGPVHAGIIEPGHFRFSVSGEPIINLEAQLFYTHKGIEKLCEGQTIEKCFFIAERISGDESFTNSMSFCQAIENIAGIQIPDRAAYTRVVFAELERLICHLGDLAGICLDVGYGFAGYQFRMLRGWAYWLTDELCGMRFLRSVNKPGGIRRDFVVGKEKHIIEQLTKIRHELEDTVKIIKSNSLFIDRVEHTGVVSQQFAIDFNAVGPAGRAAGIPCDVRRDFPYAAYGKLEFKVSEHHNGDVNCRMNVKIEECEQSINLMQQALTEIPSGKINEKIPSLQPYSFGCGMSEAPRGENIHWIMTGENNTLFRYKIRTPSFCNWPVVCHAVQGNIVPDFPLINKSFNLSYAGNDL
ncbi:MAG: NADH-quinone oxidoreductase subunit C [Bacillota bacterium]|nr:NADH-quinone oxidoreductase subunit C [Bacillota bacterium]